MSAGTRSAHESPSWGAPPFSVPFEGVTPMSNVYLKPLPGVPGLTLKCRHTEIVEDNETSSQQASRGSVTLQFLSWEFGRKIPRPCCGNWQHGPLAKAALAQNDFDEITENDFTTCVGFERFSGFRDGGTLREARCHAMAPVHGQGAAAHVMHELHQWMRRLLLPMAVPS